MAHNPAGHFHHGGNFGPFVYADDHPLFDDVDHNHGPSAWLELPIYVNGAVYEHFGTYDCGNEHDIDVAVRAIGPIPAADIWTRLHCAVNGRDWLVVHRRRVSAGR